MTAWIYGYCFVYLILFLAGRAGISRHFKKEQNAFDDKQQIGLKEVTLIIPFRNEEKRIIPLLESILKSKELPAAIFFINDHSTDKTASIIEERLKNSSFQLFTSSGNGKKAAILTGINHSKTPFVLTMDADVQFSDDYFSHLSYLKDSDMHILPVKMSSAGWRKIFEMDVYMINSLNLAANGLFRPITASGANLLFKKETFEEASSYPSHAHILSGDDQFLLADFNRTNKEIYLHSSAQLSVTTPAPASFKELLSQRLRWIQKTPSVPDRSALKIGAVQLTTTIAFFILLITTVLQENALLFMLLVGTKSLLDALLAAPYFLRLEKQDLIPLIPLYELLLPAYTLLLGIIALFSTPSWKGRRTRQHLNFKNDH